MAPVTAMSKQTDRHVPLLIPLLLSACTTVDGGPGLDLAESGSDAVPVGDIDGDGLGELELRLCTARPIELTGWSDGTCPAGASVPLFPTGIEGPQDPTDLPAAFYPESAIAGRRIYVSLRVADSAQPRFSCGDGTLLGGAPRVCALEAPRLAVAGIAVSKLDGTGEVDWRYDRAGATLPFWPAIFAEGDIPAGAAGLYQVEVTLVRSGRVEIADRAINQPNGAWWLYSEEPAYLQDEIDRRADQAGPNTGYRPFPLHATWAFADDGAIIGADATTVRFLISIAPDQA
jgi:hypothetical protein